MSAYPMIDRAIAFGDQYPGLWYLYLPDGGVKAFATELRALLAERDTAKADAKFWREQESERKELCDAWKDRAEKAEAERDALKAKRIELECAIDTISAQSVREANIADQWRAKCEKAEAARDALLAKLTPPTRKLREVEFSDGLVHRWNNGTLEWQDDDGEWMETPLVPIADIETFRELRASPYEPVETVEEVLREMFNRLWDAERGNVPDWEGTAAFAESAAARVRAAVLAEPTRGEG